MKRTGTTRLSPQKRAEKYPPELKITPTTVGTVFKRTLLTFSCPNVTTEMTFDPKFRTLTAGCQQHPIDWWASAAGVRFLRGVAVWRVRGWVANSTETVQEDYLCAQVRHVVSAARGLAGAHSKR